MGNYKVKLDIAKSLIILIVLAMISTQVVVAVFWFQSLVRQQLAFAVEVLEIIVNDSKRDLPGREISAGDLAEKMSRGLARGSVDVVIFFQEDIVRSREKQKSARLESAARKTFESGQEATILPSFSELIFQPDLRYCIITRLLSTSDGNKMVLGVAQKTEKTSEIFWSNQKIIFSYLFVNCVVLSVIGFVRLRKKVIQPIDRLVGIAENYQVEEGPEIFIKQQSSEFGQLSNAMHNMIHRVRLDRERLAESYSQLKRANEILKNNQREMVRAEKMAVAGRLSSVFAHEIGNPLAIVQGYLELLKDSQLSPQDRADFILRSQDEMARIDRLLKEFLDVSRIREKRQELISVSSVLNDLAEALGPAFRKNSIEIITENRTREDVVRGDKDLIRQVFLNLLLNAMDGIAEKNYASEDGIIEVILDDVDVDGYKKVKITVSDNGKGIVESDRDKIFEPFFTTKTKGQGTGLGLSICYQIVKSMHGDIELKNGKRNRTTFELYLPLCSEGAGESRE